MAGGIWLDEETIRLSSEDFKRGHIQKRQVGTFAFRWHAMEMRCQRPAATCPVAVGRPKHGRKPSEIHMLQHCLLNSLPCIIQTNDDYFTIRSLIMACLQIRRTCCRTFLALRAYKRYLEMAVLSFPQTFSEAFLTWHEHAYLVI